MRIVSFCFGIIITSAVFGQDVILTGKAEREIDKAQRIASVPQSIDTVIPHPVVEYPLLQMQFQTQTEVDQIEPASIKIKENLDPLYAGYIKLGVGTELMPLGELYYNSTRSRKYIYGLHAKHLSSWGNIPDYERNTFDRTKVNLFGGINEKKYSLLGDFHYRSQGLHYYAIQAPIDSLGRDTTAQRYNDIGFNALFDSRTKIDSFLVDYKVGLQYNHFNTRKPPVDSLQDWRSRENYVGVYAIGEMPYKETIYSVRLDVKYNGYKYGIEGDSLSPTDTAIVRPNTLISLKPNFKTYLWNDKFKATVGVDITFNADNGLKARIYPLAEVKYSMFNDIFIPYIGVRGGMKQRTLKSLTLQNEFIRPDVLLKNEDNVFEAYGGIKGTLSKRISFNVGGAYSRVRNMALFVTDTNFQARNGFNVIYDTLNLFKLEGSIAYQALEKLKIDVIGTYYSYELLNNSYAWNMPNFQLVTRAFYNLYDKFYLNLDFDLETGRKALVYAPGEGVKEENLQYFKELQAVYDINLGLEYRYTRRLSVFVQMNNIASQRYQRWYNAPVHSFQFLGGLTFRL